MPGNSGSRTVTTNTDPWAPQQPYLREAMQQAQNLWHGNPDPMVGMSPQTQAGLGALEAQYGPNAALAEQGVDTVGSLMGGSQVHRDVAARMAGVTGANPYAPQAAGAGGSNMDADALRRQASGRYLGANPYLDGQFDRMAGRIQERFRETVDPAIASAFAMAGERGGSQARDKAQGDAYRQLGRDLSEAGTDLYGRDHARERALQAQAAGQLGSLGEAAAGRRLQGATAAGQLVDSGLGRYIAAQQARAGAGAGDIQTRMAAAGQVGQAMAHRAAPAATLMDIGQRREEQARYEQAAPWVALERYANLVRGNLGQSTSETRPNYSNPAATGLGGLIGGARAGHEIWPGGWGAGIGAGVGGLLGLLS